MRGAGEDAESAELGRGKTWFKTEDFTISKLSKNPFKTLFLSPYSLRPLRLPVFSPRRLLGDLGVLSGSPGLKCDSPGSSVDLKNKRAGRSNRPARSEHTRTPQSGC